MAAIRWWQQWRKAAHIVSANVKSASSFSQRQASEETHAKTTMVLWKRISLFIAIPAVSYLTWKNFIAVDDHHEKREYIPWPHLRIRNKPFPWKDSDKTLFHNPLTNPGPDEEEQEVTEAKTTSLISQLWQEHLFEDPDKRDQDREAHLASMQKRHKEYLAKKNIPEGPIQPLDLISEQQVTPVNKVDTIRNTL